MIERKVKLTKGVLNKGLSKNGALNKAQFRALGYDGPFKGWRTGIVNKYYRAGQINEFLSLKNTHLKKVRNKDAVYYKNGENVTKSVIAKSRDKKVDPYSLPEWKALAREIIERDRQRCVACGKSKYDGVKLNVHHLVYEIGKQVWDVPKWYLVTLCEGCHKKEHGKLLKPPPKIF